MCLLDCSVLLCTALGIEFGSDPDLADFVMDIVDGDKTGSIEFVEFLQYIPFFIKLHQAAIELPTDVKDKPDSAATLVSRVKMQLEVPVSVDGDDD